MTWLVSARFDIAAFTLPALLALGIGALSGHLAEPSGETPTWAWLLFVVCVDVAHVHATTLRVYLNANERSRRPVLYTAAPLVAFTLSVLAYIYSAAFFWRCLAYVAVFHFVRQQVGWMRLYQRRAREQRDAPRTNATRLRKSAEHPSPSPGALRRLGGLNSRKLDELAIYAATLCPVIVWHTRLPTPFQWFMPGDFVAGLPPIAASIASVCFGLCAAMFYASHAYRALRGEPVVWGAILLFTTTAATWWGGIVVLANDFAFTVTNVIAHGVPYMLVSHRVARHEPQPKRSYIASLPAYLGALVTLAVAEEWLWDACVWHEHAALLATPLLDLDSALAFLVPLLSLPQLTHYGLDAYLWRLDGNNPAVAQTFGMRQVAPRIPPFTRGRHGAEALRDRRINTPREQH